MGAIASWGSDSTGNGTIANPYRTLKKAVDSLPIGVGTSVFVVDSGPFYSDSQISLNGKFPELSFVGGFDPNVVPVFVNTMPFAGSVFLSVTGDNVGGFSTANVPMVVTGFEYLLRDARISQPIEDNPYFFSGTIAPSMKILCRLSGLSIDSCDFENMVFSQPNSAQPMFRVSRKVSSSNLKNSKGLQIYGSFETDPTPYFLAYNDFRGAELAILISSTNGYNSPKFSTGDNANRMAGARVKFYQPSEAISTLANRPSQVVYRLSQMQAKCNLDTGTNTTNLLEPDFVFDYVAPPAPTTSNQRNIGSTDVKQQHRDFVPATSYHGSTVSAVLTSGAVSSLVNMQGPLAAFNQATPANRPTLGANGGIAFGANLRLTQVSNVPTTYTKFTLCMWVYLPSPFTPVTPDAVFFTDYFPKTVPAPTRFTGLWWGVRVLGGNSGFSYVVRDANGVGVGLTTVGAMPSATFNTMYGNKWTFTVMALDGSSLKIYVGDAVYNITHTGNGVEIGNAGTANLGSYLTSSYLPAGTEIQAPRLFYGQALSQTQLKQIVENDQKTFRHLRGW